MLVQYHARRTVVLRMTLPTTERLFWHGGAHTAEPKLGLIGPILPIPYYQKQLLSRRDDSPGATGTHNKHSRDVHVLECVCVCMIYRGVTNSQMARLVSVGQRSAYGATKLHGASRGACVSCMAASVRYARGSG